MNKVLRSLGVVSALASLVACGGGGGDPGGPSQPALAWQVAQSLESGADESGNPHVAVNASGIGYAVWEQVTAGQREVMSRRYANGVWEPAQPVTGNVDADAFDPQVMVLPDGKAIAVWWHQTAQGRRVAFTTSTQGGTWQDGVTTLSNAVDEVTGLQAVANSKGDAVLIWSEKDANNAAVIRAAVRSSVANTFAAPEKVNTENADATAPDAAIDPTGRVLASWKQLEGTTNTLRTRVFENGAWKQVFDFPGLGEVKEVQAAARSDGVAVLALVLGNDAASMLVAGNFVEQNWIALNNIPLQAGGKASNLRVVLPEQGDATVVLVEQVGVQTPSLRSVRQPIARTPEGIVLAPSAIDLGFLEFLQETSPNLPQIAISERETVVAIWQQRQGTQSTGLGPVRMITNRLEKGANNWGTPERIESEGDSDAGNAAVAGGQSGPLVAVWEQRRTGQKDILANVLR